MKILARKSLAVLLAFAVIVSMLPGFALTAYAESYSWQGDGSKDNPYLVSAEADLLEMQNSEESYEGKYFKVTQNINVANKEFTGIGSSSKPFKGAFDGDGKTITLGIEVGEYDVGLFGYLGSGAVIENVNVEGSVTGQYNVGGIAGYNNGGTVRNCTSAAAIMTSDGSGGAGGIVGNMTGGTVESCTNEGDLIAGFTSATGSSKINFGGIVGMVQGYSGDNIISDCHNKGNIDKHAVDKDGDKAPDTDSEGNLVTEEGIPSTAGVAGIVGKVSRVTGIEDCSNSGNICAAGTSSNSSGGVAGIVGYLGASGSAVERCWNTGEITGRSVSSAYTGGIVGNIAYKASIYQAFNKGDITAAGGYVGGIAGYMGASYAEIQSCYNGGAVSNTNTGKITSSYSAIGAAGIAGQLGSNYAYVKNCYSYGTVSNTATGTYAYAGGIIGKASSTTINATYINYNTYLAATASKGIGNVASDAEGYGSSADADTTLKTVGADYQSDLTNHINNGYPILRWQNPDALYSLAFNVTDKEVAAKSLKDATVAVTKDGVAQSPQTDGGYELAPGTYSYEISRTGYVTETGSVTLGKSSKTVNIVLTSVKHDYVVKVTPANADIKVANEDAPKIGEPEKTVSEDGSTATYTYKLGDKAAYGAYSYSLSKYGYDRVSGELTATGAEDETSVTMVKSKAYDCTFKVTPDNAKVTLYNAEYAVNVAADKAEGGTWTYSLIPGEYSYKVKASGYTTKEGEVTVADKSISENVSLDEKSCWDGTSTDTDWYNDKDTSFDISEPEELAGLAELVNGGKDFEGKTINLTKDVDLGSKNWTSIGNNSKKFKGTFNGNGHTVKNLYINITGTAGAANGYRGLFGQTDSAAISNLKVESISIVAATTTSYQYVGGLVGRATKTDISGITVSGNINLSEKPGSYTGGITGQTAGGSMIDCVNNAEISSGYQVAGITGTTGTSATVIKRCVNNGAVTGKYSGTTKSYAVAGIVGNLGSAKDEVLYCVNHGNISGADQSMAGIAGYTTNPVKIIDCYNTGAVTSTNAKSYVGGIIAYISNSYASSTPYIQNCYNIGELTIDATASTKYIGGIIGYQSSATVNTAYFTNNYYKANESYKGSRYSTAFDSDGAFASFESKVTADMLGNAYGEDVKDGEEYKYNSGYPILRWQNPDSLYDIRFVPVYDSEYNLDKDSSIKVSVKDSEGKDIAVTGETAQLKNGEYTYTVTQKGYKDATGSLTVDRESFEQEVSFEAIKYAYAFEIEEGADFDLVMVTEDGEDNVPVDRPEYADGKYTYELYNGTYEYTANKLGKGSETGEITVSYEGGEKEITLTAKDDATVKFTVTAAEGSSFKDSDPVVYIYNNDENDYYQGTLMGEYDSNSDISKGLKFPAGSYTYKIKADGFKAVTGEFEVTKDSDVKITKELEVKTGWGGAEDIDTDWYTDHPDDSEYTISNESQLAGLAKLVNDGTTDFAGKTVRLARDMNLADNTWTPVGGYAASGAKAFSGIFDGQGCSIIITSGNFTKSESSFGVFGYLLNATVKNLVVQGNARVDYTEEEARFVLAYVGSLAGYAGNSTIENCSNRMTFDVSIANEAGTATINLGGLVGWSVGTSYSRCSNIAAVTGDVTGNGVTICHAGGIAGFNNSSSAKTGSETVNCYNTGEISATASNTGASGGETGYAGGIFGNLSASYLTMSDCYSAADVKAAAKTAKAGALAGNASYATKCSNNYFLDNGLSDPTANSVKKTESEMKTSEFVTLLGSAYRVNANGGYPVLDWEGSVDHIRVTTDPDKLKYNDLEDFDDKGMKITAYMGADDTDGEEVVSGWSILNGKSLSATQKSVTVEYRGATVDVPVTVEQIVHTIDAGELVFDISAPKAGETPQTELASGSDKFSAAISWTKGGEAFTGEFEKGTYYRAEVTLKSRYAKDDIYWAFNRDSVPAADSAYEIKNIKFADSTDDGINADNVMTFTATFKATSSVSGLTDRVSHLYYEGDNSTFVKFGAYLDDKLEIKGGVNRTYTVRELEQLALDSNLGIEGKFGEYSLAGIRLYDLLLENGLSQNTSDDTAVYIYGKGRKPVETTIGELRSATGEDAAVIAYGDIANGMPLGSAHGPLWAVQNNISGTWCSNVSRIEIGEIKEADKYNVTFTTDPEGAKVIVKDAYGNEIAPSEDNIYSLRNGETYSYTVSMEGYSVKSGEVTPEGADRNVNVSLKTVWDGRTLTQPAQDEEGFYLIGTAEELMWWNQNYGKEGVSDNVRLTADITLNNGRDYINKWEILGTNSGYSSGGTPSYTGTFDGQGHVIRGLYINRENTIEYWVYWDGSVGMRADRISEIGMFGYAGGSAVIKNLGVEGVIEVFDRPDSMYADWIQIGGIVGLAQGDTRIENCYTNVGIKAVASTETGTTGGYPEAGWGDKCDIYAGGIAGSLSSSAKIINCYSKGTIVGAETRQVTAGGIAGGLRSKDTSVENCYSTMSIQSVTLDNPGWKSYVGGIVGNASYGDTLGHGTVKYSVALNKTLKGNNAEDITAARVAGKGDTDKLTGNLGLSSMKLGGVTADNADILNGKLIKQDEAELAKTYTACGWSEEVWALGGYPMLKWQQVPAGEDITVNYEGQNYEENTDWDGYFGEAAAPPYFNVYFRVDGHDSILAKSFTREQMTQMAAADNEGTLYYSAIGYGTAGRAVKEYVYLDTVFKNAGVSFETGDKLAYGTYYTYDYDYLMADRYYYPEWATGGSENAQKIKPVIALKSYGASSGVSRELWNYYAMQADYLYAYMLTFGQKTPSEQTYGYFTYQQVGGTVIYDDEEAANTTVKSWLASVISQAQSDCDATYASEDGKDVDGGCKYVLPAQKAKYQGYIDEAAAAMNAEDATNGSLMEAGENLAALIKSFDKIKKDGLGKNRTKLNSAIAIATEIYNDTVVSTDGSGLDEAQLWASEAQKAVLKTAIDAAAKVCEDSDASQSEIDDAAFTLISALADFAADKGKIQDAAREEAEKQLRAYVADAKYRQSDSEEINSLLKEGIRNIDNAKTVEAITQALNDALEKIKAVERRAYWSGGSAAKTDDEVKTTTDSATSEKTTSTTVKETKTETVKNESGQEITRTTATVSSDTADKLVNQAVSNKSEVIEVTVKSDSQTKVNGEKSTELEIPKSAVESIVKNTDASLVVKTDSGEVTLDNKTLETIASEADGEAVRIVVNENTQLKEEQKAASDVIGDKGMIFDLSAMAGNKEIHDFKGGRAHVNIPVPEKLKGKDIVVVYINDKGICEILNHTMQAVGADSFIRFTTTHFSTFAVVEKAEAEKLVEQTKSEAFRMAEELKVTTKSAKTSKGSIKITASADISELEAAGFTVKYKFYRSTKKSSGYKLKKTKSESTYINTEGKKGARYYYKTRIAVYYGEELLAQTELKQSSRAVRKK